MYQRAIIGKSLQWCKPLISLYVLLYLQTGSSIATPVAKLNNWRFNPEAVKLEITLSAGITPQYFYIEEPPRLVVDLPDTKLGYVPTTQNYTGAIQRIRVAQLNETVTRIVLDLAAGNFVDINKVQLQPVSPKKPTRWVLNPKITKYSPPKQPDNFLQPLPNLAPSIDYPTNNYLQLPSTLSPTITNSQQPLVTVPPLNSHNSSQPPGFILAPAALPNQPSNSPNLPPLTNSDFPISTLSNYPLDEPPIKIIEFGQPIPKPN